MYCLDANIWVYYFDAELDEHRSVREPVDGLLVDEPLFVTAVLQMEVIHYLTRQLSRSEPYVDRFLSLSAVTVADLIADDVAAAAELLDEHGETGIDGRDATVLAAMDRFDVERLWTHDEGLKRLGQRMDWLTVSDPVD